MPFIQLIKANTRMEFIEMKRYLPNTLSMIATIYIIFLGMLLGINVIGDPAQAEANIQHVIVNYIFWYLTLVTLTNIGFTITMEATRGTLEQLYMSPLGMWKILLSRLIGYMALHGVIVVGLLYLSMATANQWLYLKPDLTLTILLITLVGIVGVGFMIAGASVIFKQIQAFMQILQFILAALAFVPLSVAPILILAPFVKGVDMIRHVMIQGYSWTDFTAMDYTALIVNSVVYLFIGIFFYLKCEKIAMSRGLLGNH